MTVTRIENWDEVSRNRLLEQYKGKANFEKLVSAIAGEIQILEDVTADISLKKLSVSADGAYLNQLGAFLKVYREGDTDDDFRTRIVARIFQYNSMGTPEDMIQIFKLLMRARYVVYREQYPAGVFLTAVDASPLGSTAIIKQSLELAKPAGVSIDYIATLSGQAFSFAEDPDPNGLGFGTLSDPTVGGVMARII